MLIKFCVETSALRRKNISNFPLLRASQNQCKIIFLLFCFTQVRRKKSKKAILHVWFHTSVVILVGIPCFYFNIFMVCLISISFNNHRSIRRFYRFSRRRMVSHIHVYFVIFTTSCINNLYYKFYL